jgi:hypothetical protein
MKTAQHTAQFWEKRTNDGYLPAATPSFDSSCRTSPRNWRPRRLTPGLGAAHFAGTDSCPVGQNGGHGD